MDKSLTNTSKKYLQNPTCASESAKTIITSCQNRHVVRWYVLSVPLRCKEIAARLQKELERRKQEKEPEYEYFTPTYTKIKTERGKTISYSRPLLYNYIFIYSSENEIKNIKMRIRELNFLPRINSDSKGGGYFPYVSDRTMENFRWLAGVYANELPAYTPDPSKLIKGDRVRIIEGPFSGIEATLVSHVGKAEKTIEVFVDQCISVPLLRIEPGQYEVISLNKQSKHVYSRLDDPHILSGLHHALHHYHSTQGVSDEDRVLATQLIRTFGNLEMDSIVMRCKLCSLLLIAYIILEYTEEAAKIISTIHTYIGMLPNAPQMRALLFVTLYGCTNNHIYRNEAHALVDPWTKEEKPKKSKCILIDRLRDYDKWLGHGEAK